MPSALIGHTGFVGGNLLRQKSFDELYNSSNIESLAGRGLDLIVCSGAPAEKWKANADPEHDRRTLGRLWDNLRRAAASKVILISTIDVYPSPHQVDEDDFVDSARATPYGRHRYELELRTAEHFDALVVRLPGLFGPGLKKNVIYDLLHHHQLDRIDTRSVFQFYDVGRLWADIELAWKQGLKLVNFATEPVSVAEVASHGFDLELSQHPEGSKPARYDFRSRHAALYGGSSGYMLGKAEVLARLRRFVESTRSSRHLAA